MKKIFAIILALAMTFALSATALAEEGAGGTIKIEVTTTDGSPINGIVFTAATEGDTPTTVNGTTGNDGTATIAISDNSTYTVATPTKNGYVITADASNPENVTFTDGADEEVTLKYTIKRQLGNITISNAVVGQTYTIYRIFDVENYVEPENPEDPNAAYQVVYKVVNTWKPFFAEADNTDPDNPVPAGPGYEYIHLDVNGHPTWVEGADATAFAAAAIAWATTNNIANNGQHTIAAPTDDPDAVTNPYTFTDLPLGYYLVDSSLGALCGIDTMHPDATIDDKNEIPGVDKEPVLGENPPTLGVGEIVSYVAHITNIGGQVDVIFTDTMSGLEYVDGTIKVYEGADADTGTLLDAEGHYTFTETTNGFTIEFVDTYTQSLDATATITITYDARITDAAVGGGAQNDAEVSYNDDNSTTGNAPTTIYNTSFEIHKYHMVDGTDTLLEGATFRLSRTVDGATETAYWKLEGGNYILEGWGEIPANSGYTYDIETNATANVVLKGLGAGTYTLNETVAPDGYSLMTDNITVTITYTGTEETPNTFTEKYQIGEGEISEDPVRVLNQKGGELPSVGGIGTTIFYIIGALLMVGAAVLLIVRKKMSVMD